MDRDIEPGDVVQYGDPTREARVVRAGDRALVVRPAGSTGTVRLAREDVIAHVPRDVFER